MKVNLAIDLENGKGLIHLTEDEAFDLFEKLRSLVGHRNIAAPKKPVFHNYDNPPLIDPNQKYGLIPSKTVHDLDIPDLAGLDV